MTIPRAIPVALLAVLAASVIPAAATAEYLVPPGNSAVNQYTESLPTSGGSRDSEQSGKEKARSPRQTLGERNARRLEREGEDGRAVAAFAAATDPGDEAGEGVAEEAEAGIAGGGRDGGGGSGDSGAGGAAEKRPTAASAAVDQPSGSSRLSEVIAEATGTSSAGQLGLWLPLILLATTAWAVGYALRQRQRAG